MKIKKTLAVDFIDCDVHFRIYQVEEIDAIMFTKGNSNRFHVDCEGSVEDEK